MEKTIIALGSVTLSIKVCKLLRRNSIAAEVTTLSSGEDGGCGHGVVISEADLYGAVAILRNAQIPYSIRSEKKK